MSGKFSFSACISQQSKSVLQENHVVKPCWGQSVTGTLLPLVRCLFLCVNLVWFKGMLGKKWTPFLRNLFSRHYYQWNGGVISPEIKYVVSNKMCWKTKKNPKSHLQHWQTSKALQKIGPFYSWYLSLINFIMHNRSFIFLTNFLKHFDKVNRKHGLLTLGDQCFDNGRASTVNGIIACRVQLNMIDECNQPLPWLFKSNPFSFELQRIFQPGKARMKKFSAEHTGPMQPSHPALWVCCFCAF